MRLWIGVVLALAPAVAHAQPGVADPAPGPVREDGLFHAGVSVDLVDLGALQAFTPYGRASGVDAGITVQWDLGPQWAIRVPIELGVSGFAKGEGYGELLMIPGVIYRFRNDERQRWVPYLGGGVRLGSVGVGNALLGKPLVVACCHDWGDGDGHGDPNTESTLAMGAELWVGAGWHPTSWFSLEIAGAAGYERVLATRVFALRETLGVRIAF